METPPKLTEEQIRALCEACERVSGESDLHEPPKEIHIGFGKKGEVVETKTEIK